MIELGDEVRDKVTGFKGIAISRHSYLQGCDRINVQPKVNRKGELPKDSSFDEPQLEVFKPKATKRAKGKPGGPVRYEDTPRR